MNRHSEDLWEKAAQTLSNEDRQSIILWEPDRGKILDDIVKLVQDKEQSCIGQAWKYTRNDGMVVEAGSSLGRLLATVHKFKELGNDTSQFNPSHFSLPWAGVRSILQVCLQCTTWLSTNETQTWQGFL